MSEHHKGPSIERVIDTLLDHRQEYDTQRNEFFAEHDWTDGPAGKPIGEVLEYMDHLEHWSMAVMRNLDLLRRAKGELAMPGDPLRGDTKWQVKAPDTVTPYCAAP